MSHESAVKSNEWYTPKYVFDALDVNFDTDVASPEDRTYCSVPALSFITRLSLELGDWNGFVWMNPPFANQREKLRWLNKFVDHGNGIALMPDRTSAPWWQYISKKSDALLFVAGKIKFIKPDGSKGNQPGNGTTLFAIGPKAIKGLTNAYANGLGEIYLNS